MRSIIILAALALTAMSGCIDQRIPDEWPCVLDAKDLASGNPDSEVMRQNVEGRLAVFADLMNWTPTTEGPGFIEANVEAYPEMFAYKVTPLNPDIPRMQDAMSKLHGGVPPTLQGVNDDIWYAHRDIDGWNITMPVGWVVHGGFRNGTAWISTDLLPAVPSPENTLQDIPRWRHCVGDEWDPDAWEDHMETLQTQGLRLWPTTEATYYRLHIPLSGGSTLRLQVDAYDGTFLSAEGRYPGV